MALIGVVEEYRNAHRCLVYTHTHRWIYGRYGYNSRTVLATGFVAWGRGYTYCVYRFENVSFACSTLHVWNQSVTKTGISIYLCFQVSVMICDSLRKIYTLTFVNASLWNLLLFFTLLLALQRYSQCQSSFWVVLSP